MNFQNAPPVNSSSHDCVESQILRMMSAYCKPTVPSWMPNSMVNGYSQTLTGPLYHNPCLWHPQQHVVLEVPRHTNVFTTPTVEIFGASLPLPVVACHVLPTASIYPYSNDAFAPRSFITVDIPGMLSPPLSHPIAPPFAQPDGEGGYVCQVANSQQADAIGKLATVVDDSYHSSMNPMFDTTTTLSAAKDGAEGAAQENSLDKALTLGNKHTKNGDVQKKSSETSLKKPWNAYNIFFREERARILGIPIVEVSYGDRCKTYKRKPHRKLHGKIGFQELAKLVSERWKNLSSEKRRHYQLQAQQEFSEFLKLKGSKSKKKACKEGRKSLRQKS
jgi:hypothetical protein